MMDTAKKTAGKASEKVSKSVEQANESARPVMNAAHSLFLAGLGILALGKEEIGSAFDHLIAKGEVAEHDAVGLFNQWFDRGKKDMGKAEDKIEGILDQRIEGVLNTMNIPSKSDIDSLGRQVSNLSRKVNALDKKLEEEKKAA